MKIFDFDTIIFDLDDTIWSGSELDLWAKKLVFPCWRSGWRLYDYIGKYIELHDGVYDVLCVLRNKNKNIGFNTVGGWSEVPYDWQPPVIVLRCFGLLDFFNYTRLVQYKNGNKANFFLTSGKTVFIDDNDKHLKNVKNLFPEVTTWNRNEFISWKNLL